MSLAPTSWIFIYLYTYCSCIIFCDQFILPWIIPDYASQQDRWIRSMIVGEIILGLILNIMLYYKTQRYQTIYII